MSDKQRLPMIDQAALDSLERKFHLVRDFVQAVSKGYKTGLFLYGPGGIGKSFTVIRHLEVLEAPYQLFNSRMTAKGLFLALEHAPDAIHVLEDMERLTRDPDAQGVLRSALWAQPGHDRKITWTTATEGVRQFIFRGGLIMISNRRLADLPELRALATRIEVHRFDATEAELVAFMRRLASQGYKQNDKLVLEPEKCIEVTEHLLNECRKAGCPLDLRLQQKSLLTYLQWQMDNSTCHWHDLLAASVREATCHFRHEANPLSAEAKKARKRNMLRKIMSQTDDPKDQEKRYKAQTGAGHADFYRRKGEIISGEFDEQDAAAKTAIG